MSLIAITGGLGSGKTLTLTRLGYDQYTNKHRHIYANYHLNPDKIPFTFVDTIEKIEDMKTGAFFGDELWLWVDSRTHRQSRNRFIGMILAKSRKRGLHIYYTAQGIDQIDKRVRRVTDYQIIPELSKYAMVEGYKEPIPLICKVRWFEYMYPHGAVRFIRQKVFYTLPYIRMYDTTEEVKLLEDVQED